MGGMIKVIKKHKKKGKKDSIKQFEALLEPIYIDLYKLIFVMVKNKIVADDAMQNTLMAAYVNFHQLKDINKFRTWIFTIAKNEVFKIFKKYNRRNESHINEITMCDINAIHDSIEEMVIKNETRDQLINIINQLENGYREVIILRYYCDLSFKEISEILDINPNTIRTKHRRAKQNIFNKLIDIGDTKEGGSL